MIGYDLYNLQRDYPGPATAGLRPMPASAPGATRKPSVLSSLWGKAKGMLPDLGTEWGDGGPVAEGKAMGALSTGSSALAGILQMGEDEKAQQRQYGMDELAMANQMYEARRKRLQQTNALRAAAAVG